MKNCQHDDLIRFDAIIDRVGKPESEDRAEIPMNDPVPFAVCLNLSQRTIDFGDAFATQSRPLPFVPIRGCVKFTLGCAAQNKGAHYCGIRANAAALASSHGTTSSGRAR